ncbi:MAG: lytic transglycosylase domain-containing protein [Aquificae bacterium]|nr:lytic transglycosylase domain-containing protein [Aquificota bacterium]
MERIILAVFLIFFSVSYSIERCLTMFNNEDYTKALRCFQTVKKEDTLYPYSLYYQALIQTTAFDGDISNILKEMERFKNTAVYTYLYLYLSSLKGDKKYFYKVDPKALMKDDKPFYYYLKYQFEGDKTLLKKYAYHRYYGFPVFLSEVNKLSQKEIYQAIDSMISKRMYKRALYSTRFLKDSSLKRYYVAVLNARLKRWSKAYSMLDTLPQHYRDKLSFLLLRLTSNTDKQRELFHSIKDRETKLKAAYSLMVRSFYRRRFKDFFYYRKFLPETSRGKTWLTFLYKYQYEGDKKGAYQYLKKRQNLFKKEKSKIYYWLYLSSKDKKYLQKTANLGLVDFYVIRAREKLGLPLFKEKKYPYIYKENYNIKLAKKLRDTHYHWGYREAKYYLKRNKNQTTLHTLYRVYPEITAVYFVSKHHISKQSYPKPYSWITEDNLVYAVMRRESFFNPYIISVANAVGLMQIIPPTAKWIAKKKGDKNFDIVMLFEPEKNIDYGSWLLDYLKDYWNGNIYYTVASYNGGQKSVKMALKGNKFSNIEEVIELIPYRETRYYVKYVYTNYKAYQQLYR